MKELGELPNARRAALDATRPRAVVSCSVCLLKVGIWNKNGLVKGEVRSGSMSWWEWGGSPRQGSSGNHDDPKSKEMERCYSSAKSPSTSLVNKVEGGFFLWQRPEVRALDGSS